MNAKCDDQNETITKHFDTDTVHLGYILPQKGGIVQMEDLELTMNVTQANELILAIPHADATSLKIFETVVAGMDVFSNEQSKVVEIDKKALISVLKIHSKKPVVSLKRMIKKAMEELIFDFSKSSLEGDIHSAITTTRWNKNKPQVTFVINDELMPYLTGLEGNYTIYSLNDIADMASRNSIILYKILRAKYSKGDYLDRHVATNYENKNPALDVEFLKEVLGVKGKYNNFNDFNRFVIKKSVKEINEKTSLIVIPEFIAEGKSITKIRFKLSENKEKLDLKGLARMPEEQVGEITDSIKVEIATGEYMKILQDNLITNVNEVLSNDNTAQMLYFKLFPIWEGIKKEIGTEGLLKHISYVISRKDEKAFNENSIAYFITSSSAYLNRIKHEGY